MRHVRTLTAHLLHFTSCDKMYNSVCNESSDSFGMSFDFRIDTHSGSQELCYLFYYEQLAGRNLIRDGKGKLS